MPDSAQVSAGGVELTPAAKRWQPAADGPDGCAACARSVPTIAFSTPRHRHCASSRSIDLRLRRFSLRSGSRSRPLDFLAFVAARYVLVHRIH
jgi:hypothetical protein